jgi:hypothetical protein
MTFTVHVVGKGRKPVADAEVSVRLGGVFSGGWCEGETDEDGQVTFSTDVKPMRGEIFVKGDSMGEKSIKDDGNYTVHYHG